MLADKSGKDLRALQSSIPANAIVINGVPGAPVADSPTRLPENETFFDFQVERQATPRPNNPAPRYPDALRQANVEGEVMAQFIVTTDGTADMSTFKVLRSTDDGFTEAVARALPNMKFYPAEVGGRPVSALIQMPFVFDLTKNKP